MNVPFISVLIKSSHTIVENGKRIPQIKAKITTVIAEFSCEFIYNITPVNIAEIIYDFTKYSLSTPCKISLIN